MRQARSIHSAACKSKVAVVALEGERTLEQRCDAHADRIAHGRLPLLGRATGAFAAPDEKGRANTLGLETRWRGLASTGKPSASSVSPISSFASIAALRRLATAVALGFCMPTIAHADMPNASFTPGAVAATDAHVVCAYGYASGHRKVPYAERDAIYRKYGIPRGTRYASPRRGYRIDHLIPLELGGANTMRNLWPERYADSKVKDRVEGALHQAVCLEHTITLQQAQAAIARDWTRTPVGLPQR